MVLRSFRRVVLFFVCRYSFTYYSKNKNQANGGARYRGQEEICNNNCNIGIGLVKIFFFGFEIVIIIVHTFLCLIIPIHSLMCNLTKCFSMYSVFHMEHPVHVSYRIVLQ